MKFLWNVQHSMLVNLSVIDLKKDSRFFQRFANLFLDIFIFIFIFRISFFRQNDDPQIATMFVIITKTITKNLKFNFFYNLFNETLVQYYIIQSI